MNKYDNLDPRTELEQFIAAELKKALEKRGFQVKHNGTYKNHAPAGQPDIEIWDNINHICVEVTKRKKSQQDGEYQAIKDHLTKLKKNKPNKQCYLWFISPETYYRTLNSIKEHNFINKDKKDMKILPICFNTFELFITKLTQSVKEIYTKENILTLFENTMNYVDDENILKHFYEKLFTNDLKLKKEVEFKEENKHQKVVEELIFGFKELENKLRQHRIATSTKAIMNVIYLVFIKLYEEKQESEEKEKNRFTLNGFTEYQKNQREYNNAVHKLFENIKNDEEIKECGLLTEDDKLETRLNDAFVIENFIKPFEKHHFYTTKIDGLGAAYEVLGELSGKDTKVGQFFTPENVVQFMVKLADLYPTDTIYDPACGTARFLTYSMQDMIKKARDFRNAEIIVEKITKEQLYGTDDDPTVAKLAKMNMYINGDGKTNIVDSDGLTFYRMDGNVDVILTNPPLGNLSYRLPTYNEDFLIKRMEIIPRKNKSEDDKNKIENKINELNHRLDQTKNNLKQAKKISSRIKYYTRKLIESELQIEKGNFKFVTTGNQMKGGALFLNASKYYLKNIRDSNVKTEWKGGKLLIILDEGILNTSNYSNARDFIKKYFYIKAIISLSRDTFIPVSKTSTKTSILYAIKKDDTNAIQQEPIFFGHVEKVGIDTRKRICENHLFNDGNNILSKYQEFKEKVLSSYDGEYFNKDKFLNARFEKGTIE